MAVIRAIRVPPSCEDGCAFDFDRMVGESQWVHWLSKWKYRGSPELYASCFPTTRSLLPPLRFQSHWIAHEAAIPPVWQLNASGRFQLLGCSELGKGIFADIAKTGVTLRVQLSYKLPNDEP